MSDDLFSRYPAFHGRADAMAMFCGVLRDRGLYADAFAMGRAAVAAAPHSMAVRDEVRRILSANVDRFHIPMLHDDARNRAYVRAIEKAVRPGMKVLEIGTGAGLLALIAARAGAEVTTCEANPMVAAAAVEIVAQSGLAERIRIIPKMSSDVQIPDDLAEPADLLIHEIFGSEMVNEGVVPALVDARARLLKPGAPAVPPRSCVTCVLVGGVRPNHREDIAMVEGFDLSPFNLLSSPSRRLTKIAATSVTMQSDVIPALALDFDAPPPFGPRAETITLESRGGRVDGVMQWMRLDFGDGDILENSPFDPGPDSSWSAPVTRFPNPIETRPGDLIDITLRHRGMMLTIDAVAINGAPFS